MLQSDGAMERTYTYTYVSDAASAVLGTVLTYGAGTYNVANEQSRVSIRELAEAFQRHSPVPGGGVVTRPRTPTGLWSRAAGSTYLDCSRLRGIGWVPRVSVDEGVRRWIRHACS